MGLLILMVVILDSKYCQIKDNPLAKNNCLVYHIEFKFFVQLLHGKFGTKSKYRHAV